MIPSVRPRGRNRHHPSKAQHLPHFLDLVCRWPQCNCGVGADVQDYLGLDEVKSFGNTSARRRGRPCFVLFLCLEGKEMGFELGSTQLHKCRSTTSGHSGLLVLGGPCIFQLHKLLKFRAGSYVQFWPCSLHVVPTQCTHPGWTQIRLVLAMPSHCLCQCRDQHTEKLSRHWR